MLLLVTSADQIKMYGTLLLVSGLLCDLLWSDPDKDVDGWGENDRGVSFTFDSALVNKFLVRHDLDLITRAHQVQNPNHSITYFFLHCIQRTTAVVFQMVTPT